MYYAITNEEGRTIESFDDELDARHAVRAMVDEDPDFADDVTMLVYADQAAPIAVLGWADLWVDVIDQPSPIRYRTSPSTPAEHATAHPVKTVALRLPEYLKLPTTTSPLPA